MRDRRERDDDAISIHALLAESDRRLLSPAPAGPHFYPRSPCGERPSRPGRKDRRTISIHALLAESDFIQLRLLDLA